MIRQAVKRLFFCCERSEVQLSTPQTHAELSEPQLQSEHEPAAAETESSEEEQADLEDSEESLRPETLETQAEVELQEGASRIFIFQLARPL